MGGITRPRLGNNLRITRAGYVDGIFIIDGKRAFKGLCKLADIEMGAGRRKRTLKQVNALIQQMWDEKREVLIKEAGITPWAKSWRSGSGSRPASRPPGRSPPTG